jgi:DNA-binding transcriptional ArsR family regulator
LTAREAGEDDAAVVDIAVIDDPATAIVALDEARARMLAELVEPQSAAALAARSGMPRQRANYHVRELERRGLVTAVGERRRGNMTERLMQATARSYVISPAALAAVAPDPSLAPDRLSASWLLAVAAKLVRDVGALITGAERAQKRLATFTVVADVRFASAADRAAFAGDLAASIAALVAKYHNPQAPGGRDHRLVLAVHPAAPPAPPPPPEPTGGEG